MRKFLLLFFACLCSLIPLGAWADDDDTEDPFIGFWYYVYQSSFHTTYTDEAFSDAISSLSISLGSNFKDSGNVTATNSLQGGSSGREWKWEKITYSTVESSAADDNAIDFTFNVADGYKFTPTGVKFYIKPGNGTDTSKYTYLDFTWKSSSDDEGTALGSEVLFSSDNTTHLIEFSATDFAGVTASTSSCTLRVNLFGEDNEGYWDICDVKIYGTVETSDGETSELTFSPENGATISVDEFDGKVTIYCEGGIKLNPDKQANSDPSLVEQNGDYDIAMIHTHHSGTTTEQVTELVESSDGKSISLYPKTSEGAAWYPTETGTITLAYKALTARSWSTGLPGDLFLFGSNGVTSEEAIATDYSFDVVLSFDLQFEPASGTQQTKLSTIKVSSTDLTDDDGVLQVIDSDENNEVFVIDSDADEEDVNDGKVARVHYDNENGELYLTEINSTTTKQLSDVGHTYTIELPQSYFATSISQKQSNSASLSYTIIEDTSEKVPFDITDVDPVEGKVDSLQYITISYTNGLNVAATDGSSDELVKFEAPDGNTYYLAPGLNARSNQTSIQFEIEDENASATVLTTPGEYKITFPEGYFTDSDGNPSKEFTLTYTIESSTFDLTLDPPAGEVTLKTNGTFGDVTITAESTLSYGEGYSTESALIVTNAEGTTVAYGLCDNYNSNTNVYMYGIYGDEEGTGLWVPTESGDYTLTIPEGFFVDKDDNTPCAGTETVYTITIASSTTVNINIDTEGSEVSEDGTSITVAITTEDDVTLEVAADSGKMITITTTEDDETTTVAYATAKQDEDTGAWTLSFVDENGDEKAITAAGEYTITIPEGYFTTEDGTIVNAEATATFTIPTPPITIEIDTEGSEVSEDGTSITVAITAKDEEGEDIKLEVPEDSDKMITITTGEGDDLETVAYATAEQDADGNWTLSFVDEDGEEVAITAAGEYTITIPEGYFTTEDGVVNAEATATFTIEETTDTPLYATDFTDWTTLNYKNTNGDTVTKTTATGGNLTFTFYGVGVDPTKTDSSKFPDYTGTMITAKNPDDIDFDPYATTSVLGSIDKIEFTQVATGNSRGITIAVRGTQEDGTMDEDWVYLFNQSITTASGETHVLDVNRTNCQIKFGSFNSAQNAYVADLKIYGTDADEITATWDWVNNYPQGIQDIHFENNGDNPRTGYVDSDKEGVELYVDASNGKLQGRSSGDAQFNKNTIIYVPVSSVGDVVTITSDTGYHYYTVGGTPATADVTAYSPTAEEVETGWVAIVSTDDDDKGVYIQSISATLYQFTASKDAFTLEVEDEVIADDDESITITFDKIDLTVAEDISDKQITVTTGEGEDITIVAYATVSIHSGICTFTFISPDPDDEGAVIALTAGTYSINIPDGYFVDAEGAEAEGMEISFEIPVEPIALVIDTENSELSEDGTSITVAITTEDDVTLEVAADSGKMITITTTENDETTTVAYATAEQDETTGEWTLSFVGEDGETSVEITAPGEYTITIPEGYFTTETGAENAEATGTFTIPTPQITIEIDTENSELSEDGTSITVVITDEDGEAVALTVAEDSGKMITITTTENDETTTVAYAIAEQDEDTGEWTLSFVDAEDGVTPVAITDAGTYTITIPEGYFTTEEGAVNAEATATFTIEEETEPIAIEIDTENAELSEDGTSITVAITTEDDVTLEVAEDSGKVITITTGEGDDLETVAYATAEQDADGNWVISFVDEDGESVEITDAGTYTITIPEGYFTTEEGAENAEATATFEIKDNLYETLCEEIEALETNLEETWSTIKTDYSSAAEDASIIAKKEAIESEISTLQEAVDASNAAGTLADDAEKYEAQIADIQIEIEQLLSDAKDVASGIDSITIDKFEGKSIYTISGQKVSTPTKSGIYIIDGKKVVIK